MHLNLTDLYRYIAQQQHNSHFSQTFMEHFDELVEAKYELAWERETQEDPVLGETQYFCVYYLQGPYPVLKVKI